MRAIAETSPYIRKATSTKRMMADVLIALIPVIAFAVLRFKLDFVFRALLACGLAVGVEALFFGLMKEKEETWQERFKKYTVNNIIPPVITAIIFVLTLSSEASYFVVGAGTVFAILIGKMIFGGLGRNIFNPAGIGRVFVALALGSLMGNYLDIDGVASTTALSITQNSLANMSEFLKGYSFLDLLIGNVPGTMGEISAIAILIGAAYLIIRRSADFRVMLTGVLSFSLFILVAALAVGTNFSVAMEYTLYHVLSGGLLFGLVFMATDPATSPYTRPGRLVFGLIIGTLVAVIRLFGALPEGMVFAIVIANAFVPLIDYKKWTTNVYTKKFVVGYFLAIILLALFVYLGASSI